MLCAILSRDRKGADLEGFRDISCYGRTSAAASGLGAMWIGSARPSQPAARHVKMKAMPNPSIHGIEIPRAVLAAFCLRNRIRKLSLFGSILTSRFQPESDIDILVEFERGAPVTYLDMARMEGELSEILGRKADLRTLQELSRYFRDAVVRDAVPQ